MTLLSRALKMLKRDARGASAVEFALLAPVFIALMMGVVEVGIYMQNYNAVRSLAADGSRFATVQYQKNNALDAAALERDIKSIGVASPYNLSSDALTVTVTEVTPSRVNGSREFTLAVAYALPDFIGGTRIDNITLNYSRPMFVLDV